MLEKLLPWSTWINDIEKCLIFHHHLSMLSFLHTCVLKKFEKNCVIYQQLCNSKIQTQKNFKFWSLLLGQSFQSNIISVEIGVHGMIHVGDIVFHAESKQNNTAIRYIFMNIILFRKSLQSERNYEANLICALSAASDWSV